MWRRAQGEVIWMGSEATLPMQSLKSVLRPMDVPCGQWKTQDFWSNVTQRS